MQDFEAAPECLFEMVGRRLSANRCGEIPDAVDERNIGGHVLDVVALDYNLQRSEALQLGQDERKLRADASRHQVVSRQDDRPLARVGEMKRICWEKTAVQFCSQQIR